MRGVKDVLNKTDVGYTCVLSYVHTRVRMYIGNKSTCCQGADINYN